MKSKRRNNHGNVSIELAVALPVVIAVLCIAINLGLTLLSARANDLACRDAARAAAQCDDLEQALQAAKAAASGHAFFGRSPRVVVEEFSYDTNGGDTLPPSGAGPNVKVVTAFRADLPFIARFYGAGFDNETLEFRRAYTFPIMKLKERNRSA